MLRGIHRTRTALVVIVSMYLLLVGLVFYPVDGLVRWLVLAAAAFLPVAAWYWALGYRRVSSPHERAAILAQGLYHWSVLDAAEITHDPRRRRTSRIPKLLPPWPRAIFAFAGIEAAHRRHTVRKNAQHLYLLEVPNTTTVYHRRHDNAVAITTPTRSVRVNIDQTRQSRGRAHDLKRL